MKKLLVLYEQILYFYIFQQICEGIAYLFEIKQPHAFEE